MRLRSVAAVAAIMGLVCPAFASVRLTATTKPAAPAQRIVVSPALETSRTSTIDPARPRRAASVLVAVVVHGRAEAPVPRVPVLDHSVTLEMAGDSTRPSEASLPLAIAPGMHVTAMTVTVAGRRTQAVRALPWVAASDFGWTVRRELDPALLEQTAPGALQLRVFPVTTDQHAIVELTVEPDAVDDWMHTDPHPGVDEAVSLVAIEARPVVTIPGVTIDGCTGYRCGAKRLIDTKIIRRYVKLAEPRLANCWQRELFHAPSLEGTAELHFTILRDGTIGAVTVDGSLDSDAAKRCMADDIATWRFPETDELTRANYPLTFQVTGE